MASANHKTRNNGGRRWPALAMVIAILAISGFQGYWLKNNYDRERQNLEIKTNAAFRQTILKLQSSKLKFDKFNVKLDSQEVGQIVVKPGKSAGKRRQWIKPDNEPTITLLNLIQERIKDSLGKNDSVNGMPIVAIGGKNSRNLSRDSINAMVESRLRAAGISQHLDSFKITTDVVQDMQVIPDKHQPSRMITISYGKPGQKSNIPDSTIRYMGPPPGFIAEGEIPDHDEDVLMRNGGIPPKNAMFRFLYNIDSLSMKDSVTVKEVDSAYGERLKQDAINVGFTVLKLDSTAVAAPNTVTIGFTKSTTFGLSLQNTFGYMAGKLKMPVLFSLLLLAITIAAFVMLYRNMVKQQKLAQLKNEFISNVTHELKTPIATVGVAIEALKNFNALDDPRRTREYLDISQNELQRLNLLVDKVLKLAIFENKAIELKKEDFDLKRLTEEVMATMKLQFEKCHAVVSLSTNNTEFVINADKLHITSVIYNLLDNALKYSGENPEIEVRIASHEHHVSLSVKDNGIGIPPEYKAKVFEKFFRVPTGDKHNIKGYGLGLSYVYEVAKKHHGVITVDSEPGKGSTFTLDIPYRESTVVQFDSERKITKEKLKFGH